MKANRFSRITKSTLLIIMTFLLCISATSVVGQNTSRTSDKLENERADKTASTYQDAEGFRADMRQYLNDLGNALSNFEAVPAVREQFGKEGIDPVAAIDRAKADLEKISAEDLGKMQVAYAKYPNWKQSAQAIYEISQKVGNKTYTRTGAGKTLGNPTNNVITPDTCPDISGTPSYTDIAITKAFEIAADAVMEALPTDFLSILAREISVVARAGLKAAILAEETLRGIYEFCISPTTEDVQNITTAAKEEIIANDNGNTTNIITNDNGNTTNIINNDNTNKDTIVANDNANTTTIVNNDNANTLALTTLINATRVEILNTVKDSKEETNNLLLRTQIEADLASTDGSTFVALYETPSNVCKPSLNQQGLPQIGALSNPVQCGLLDLVRSIVRDTIANVNTGTNAAAFFAQGDLQRAAGQYKAAYASYRKAYKAASN